MAKRVWLSFPLTSTSETNDAAVVSFLKGGLKKELEVETATFITKWMLEKSIPFHIDVERSSPERSRVVAPEPVGSQNAPDSVPVPVVVATDKNVEIGDVAEHGADTAVEQIAEASAVAVGHAGEQAKAVNDAPASQLNAPGGTGLGRARGRAGRRAPEASKAEE